MSESLETRTAFRPVKCTEEALETGSPREGYVYFATDSQKIYLGNNGEFLAMGGSSSGVYYAEKTFEDSDAEAANFVFSVNDFKDGELPGANGLIINVGENTTYNGFYKVEEILSDTEVLGAYLPVGGGGSGGGDVVAGFAAIEYVNPTIGSDQILAYTDYTIQYNLKAQDSNGDDVSNGGIAVWSVNKKQVAKQTAYVGLNEFKIDPYLDPSAGENIVKLTITIDTGGAIPQTVSKTWTIKVVDLSLEWNYSYGEQSLIKDSTFTLEWIPYGGVDCTTHIIFNNNWTPGEGYFTKTIRASQTGSKTSMTLPSMDYGVYDVEMYLTADIEGIEYKTNSIFNKLTFVSGGTSTLLTVPFYQTYATQYDTISIPFMAYNPNNSETAVSLSVNGNIISTDNYDRGLHHWNYTIPSAGLLELKISAGSTSISLAVQVGELSLDVEEAEGAAFALNLKNLSTNNEIREWKDKNVTLSFSENFDWKNGGLKTEQVQVGEDEQGNPIYTIRKYICVKNNTWMKINYNLFGNSGKQYGKNFKIIFKATNCYDYNAQVLNCYEERSGIGIRMNAQEAILTSSNTRVDTQYCEDSYIEFEADIWKYVEETNIEGKQTADNFMMLWVDGIPAGVEAYTSIDSFQQSSPDGITIGSPDCDVYVYLVKAYERYLTEDEHINNFICDAPYTEELLKRYERNDILDNNGQISYARLIEKNPECPVYLYRIDRMTKNKKDKVTGCDFEMYYGTTDAPKAKASNVTIKVQGTSSAAYGVAAYNIDSEFKDGMTDAEGNPFIYKDEDGNIIDEYTGFWAMRENSIPIDYACTKVNVASCENANNAINQDWYHTFQPYHDGHRRKNEKARDCMEFVPGIMFIKDENDKIFGKDTATYNEANIFSDDEKYVRNPTYRQYSICNMGNSKDNIHVFHDLDNPKACCVEVCDNQNAEHWMNVPVTEDIFVQKYDENGEEIDFPYEFRYPDGNDEASAEMKKAFVDFVNWMAASNPAAATNEPLSAPVTYGPYTFKGFLPPGFKNEKNEITLKGLTVSEYAGTYDTDSYKYRMAKMLQECEDHLVMDSVVYHYLFIERHTMVDNVAKNTFWSTEDLQHWDLTKNYDNDTADGNDNSGYLTFSYGLECMDLQEDGVQHVFNAYPSVWFNFIHGLTSAQKALYQALHSKGAWDASSYLNRFKAFQDIIPERCWVYDYFRKYIRPRRLAQDENTYLRRLEGGKKTHQRKQYETYQQYYLDSKYETGLAGGSNLIDMRLNSKEALPDGMTTPVSMYIDCYVWTLIGGQKTHKRVKRREICEVPIKIVSANDSTCYYYLANFIQTLGGISPLYPTYINLGAAKKLRTIELGSDAEGYHNNNLETATFSGNTMLEKACVQNVGKGSVNEDGLGALDLKALQSLKELRMNGSTYSGLALADGGVIETLYLNGVKSLELANLENLETLEIDEDIYNNLYSLSIENCSKVDTYDLVKNSPGLSEYFLKGINWTIEENSLTNGKLLNIDILDKLLTMIPIGGSTAASLTGTITIKLACSVDVFEIYKKYCKQYPNLEIIYDESVVETDPAVKLDFLTDDTDSATVYYSVLGSGDASGDNMGVLISADGPTGEALINPSKTETQAHTYLFTGYWNGSDGNKYYDGSVAEPEAGSKSLLDLIPMSNIIFTPVFSTIEREYFVRFYSGNQIVLQNGREEWYVKYGRLYDGPISNFLYKEPNDLAEDYRYRFLGWAAEPNSKKPNYIDILNYQVVGNINLYAYFEEENVREKATDNKYFYFDGDTINLHPQYKGVLQGRITLPSKSDNGTVLKTIGNFQEDKSLITHIYFLNDAKYTTISDGAFKAIDGGCNIEAIYLPSTVTRIGDYAFDGQITLKEISLNDNISYIGEHAFSGRLSCGPMQVFIHELPEKLTTLGGSAFWMSGPNIHISKLPTGLTKLLRGSFSFTPNVRISSFGTETSDVGLQAIEESALYWTGNQDAYGKLDFTYVPEVKEITFNKSVKQIGKNSFLQSYGSELDIIHFCYGIENYNNGQFASGGDIELYNYTGLYAQSNTTGEEGGIIA